MVLARRYLAPGDVRGKWTAERVMREAATGAGVMPWCTLSMHVEKRKRERVANDEGDHEGATPRPASKAPRAS